MGHASRTDLHPAHGWLHARGRRHRRRAMTVRRRIVIDTDPGIDDAVAILLALASPELELLAVTTVAGNCPLSETTPNAMRVLEFAGRRDIPVHAGCSRPLLREQIFSLVRGRGHINDAVLPPATGNPA